MSQLLSTSVSRTPFNRIVKQNVKFVSLGLGKHPTNSWLSMASGRKGFCFTASSSAAMNGGTAEVSENDKALQSYAWPDKKKPRICILGGGFGGLYTALKLESLVWPDEKKPQVLLIDQSKNFVFKPMLYELLSGEVEPWEIAPPFADLLTNTSIQFRQDRAKYLHPVDDRVKNGPVPCAGSVHLESGAVVDYDWLVLALGAGSKLDLVPGAADYALPFSTIDDACKVNDKLKEWERKNFSKGFPTRVVVVGCGYSGVELAATISERLQDKGVVQAVNVENTICPSAPPGNREAALKILQERNVELLLGYIVSSISKASEKGDQESEKVDPVKLNLELKPAERGIQGQTLEADLVLWTVGSKPQLPQLEPCDRPQKIPLNSRGQVETDETLRVKGSPHIFAIGDSAAFRDSTGKILPATAQVAIQQADYTGWNLWAAINDRPLLPFRFQNLGEMITLGRYDGAVSPSFIDGLTLEGPIGHTARKLAYLIRLPTDEHRLKVGVSWFAKTAIDSVAILQNTLTKALSGS